MMARKKKSLNVTSGKPIRAFMSRVHKNCVIIILLWSLVCLFKCFPHAPITGHFWPPHTNQSQTCESRVEILSFQGWIFLMTVAWKWACEDQPLLKHQAATLWRDVCLGFRERSPLLSSPSSASLKAPEDVWTEGVLMGKMCKNNKLNKSHTWSYYMMDSVPQDLLGFSPLLVKLQVLQR